MKYEHVPKHKISVIYNGFFNIPDKALSPVSKHSLHIPEDAYIIGIVANLREVKRLDLFIQIAARLKTSSTYFLIIGNGPLRESILSQAKDAGLENRLQIQHTLGDIFDYIKLFDIGVLTSASEGLSNTLIEYQLCGKPAVAFDVGGSSEVITQVKQRYRPSFDALDDMADTLDNLLKDQEHRQKLGNMRREQAKNMFSGNHID